MAQLDEGLEIAEVVSEGREAPANSPDEQRLGFIYAALAVLLFGSSAVLVVKARPVGPFEITFGRMLIATLFVIALRQFNPAERRRPTGITRRDWPRFAVYGLVAATHFVLYVAALSFTTAAHDLTIIYTSPVFVTLGSALFLKEKIKSRKWLGVALVAVGVGVLAGFEPNLSGQMLLGDLMALGSAIAYGVYSLIGRSNRQRYSLLGYTAGVYGFATLWLLPVALFGFLTGPGWSAYSWLSLIAIVALGIGPLGMGHTLYNAALRRIHATYANVIATQEVTFGVALAWLFLDQPLSLSAWLGVAITLGGTLLVLL